MASLFARALAGGVGGLGAGVAAVANKYLDQQLLMQKETALAELRRSYAVQTEKDLDNVRNDPERRERMRVEATKDSEATAAVNLAADIKRATDPTLRQATIDNAVATTTAQEGAKRDATKAAGADPDYLKSAKLVADATRAPESSVSLAQAELVRLQTAAARRLEGLRTKLAEAVKAGDTAEEKDLRAQLDVFESKPGKEDKLRAAIESADKTIVAAIKILNDPAADPTARKEAEETVRQARERIADYSAKLGVDISKDLPQPPPAAVEALKREPKRAAEFDAKFGPGAAARILQQPYTPPAGPATAPAAASRAAAPAGMPQNDIPEGQALDAAKQALQAAQAEVQKWGLVQRNKDPAGFQRAQQALQAAQQAEQQARAAYDRAVDANQPAFRRP